MMGMEMAGKAIDTAHRLAESRKVVLSALGIVAAGVTESIPYLVQWMQLFGTDPAKQAKLEATCHAFAAGLVLITQWLNKLTKDEDVALKTPMPPPPPRVDGQTNTVNVAAAPPVKP